MERFLKITSPDGIKMKGLIQTKKKHVYVMLSDCGLVKIGVSQNVILRAQNFLSKPVQKKIIKIAYTEQMPEEKALMYEAALIGKYRRDLVDESEWCTAKFENVCNMLGQYTGENLQFVSLGSYADSCPHTKALLDEYMKNEGYTMKFLYKHKVNIYFKMDGDTCVLRKKTVEGYGDGDVLRASCIDTLKYIVKNKMEFVKDL